MPNNMVMIHADILKVTKKFVTVRCEDVRVLGRGEL